VGERAKENWRRWHEGGRQIVKSVRGGMEAGGMGNGMEGHRRNEGRGGKSGKAGGNGREKVKRKRNGGKVRGRGTVDAPRPLLQGGAEHEKVGGRKKETG